ncbi:HNH endonuclease [Radiobacillus kanasensis]|uniref:HNH endonuclease n=1 Tax=Radiobacillus kanasensis TaxID=2844358 RepID=UPI001E40042E|nr:HNH endonuclease [Radiobacillus kanasensis]UFU00417.1 HNH endonuclease [Radiobacillus kanasensis]
MKKDYCELCGRDEVKTTVHHLLPKEKGGTFGATANLCIPCHKQIHALYTNDEIAIRLTSLEDLRQDDQLSRFIKWIRKQPPTRIMKIRKSNERKRNGR